MPIDFLDRPVDPLLAQTLPPGKPGNGGGGSVDDPEADESEDTAEDDEEEGTPD
ncbi:MAG TPA: hypothetical protein VHT53_11230 [Candidatus Elarobacter sp.]|jgi:hypothetical protein|nr:hypothetical protein [Candidatus Elarobacter sp.]